MLIELENLLQKCITSNFSSLQNSKTVDTIENMLLKNGDSIPYNLYIKASTIIGYYYGKSFNYYKSQKWLNKIPVDDNNLSWKIFKKILIPIIINNESDEKNVITTLKRNLDNLLHLKNPFIVNTLILDHSFWYGYLDNNPKELYEKYAKLQINMSKMFGNDISNNNIEKKSKTIKLGIISSSLSPLEDNRQPYNIHSSSISDSFYSTFLALPKDKFDVVFIYCNHNKRSSSFDDNNLYIPKIDENFNSVFNVQKKIRELNLDILLFLDLHIHPILNWIALNKLAKIQMCTHGHPVTSGIPRNIMNYFISWEAAEIETAQEHYTEELILIPKNIIWERFIPRNDDNQKSMLTNIHWGNINREYIVGNIPNLNLYDNWYFCSQATFKINYKFDSIIKKIQERDSKAKIILIKNNNQLHSMNNNLENRFKLNGINLNRIIFIDKLNHHHLMAMYNISDVILDSYFFGGDTTTREALEIGAPIITLPHKYLGSRWTQAYYKHIGITELIARDENEYVDLALEVANNKSYAKELKNRIKNNATKLFYSEDAVKGWSDAFTKVYEKI